MTDTIDPSICPIHLTPREWIIDSQDESGDGGFWFCQDCNDDAEEAAWMDSGGDGMPDDPEMLDSQVTI